MQTPVLERLSDFEASTGKKSPLSRFSRKELDEETGFYYYGARYLNPKTSMWISADPAMSDYIPSAPVDDEARKRNENLPSMGGVFSEINLHVYHYGGNNPIKYIDEWGFEKKTFTNSSTFTTLVPIDKDFTGTGIAYGLFCVTIMTTVVVDTETYKADIFAYATDSAFRLYDVEVATSAELRFEGLLYDQGVLTPEPSVLPTGYVSLGSVVLNIPMEGRSVDVATVTSYKIKSDSGVWFPGHQKIVIPIYIE
jgi:RHS repeat-associated protein